MEVVLLFVGVLVGSIITLVIRRKRPEEPVGTLWVDQTESIDQPDIFLELFKEARDISDKRYVTLKISTTKHVSQK